jgi:hypothetical protein
MTNFRPVDRDTGFLMPPSVDDWLPDRHWARFVLEAIAGLDLRAMTGSYRGSGEKSYHPSVLLGLLVFGYASGMFSSRTLERAGYDSVAFRFIAANQHPDHDTIATFRWRARWPSMTPGWRQAALWWLPAMCFRRRTTSSRWRRCWQPSRHCQRHSARPRLCWPIQDISAGATSMRTNRLGSSR